MKVIEVPVTRLAPASWNSNSMDSAMLSRLRRSIETFGFLEPLVIRKLTDGTYEVIGGSHRLKILMETGAESVPCVVVDADDAKAMLLSQALNHIEGEEDPLRRAESMQRILDSFAMEDVLSLLPETAEGLSTLINLGKQSPEDYMRSWNLRKKARLNHQTFQLTDEQLDLVEQALSLVDGDVKQDPSNPNKRGNGLAHICEWFIESRGAL